MLGLNAGILWNRDKMADSIDNVIIENVSSLTNLIAHYDFTDQQTVFKDNSGLINIGADEYIGRVNNKTESARKLGAFLRGWRGATSIGAEVQSIIGPGGFGTVASPKFKLNGINGLSYAQFDRAAVGGFGQSLMCNDYYDFNSRGHGGGGGFLGFQTYTLGGFYPALATNGEASPNNNTFSFANTISNHALTVFWVVRPDEADPGGIGEMTHWVIKPDLSSDTGDDRSGETFFEGYTQADGDKFRVRANFEDQGVSGITYTTDGDTLDVTDTVNVFVTQFASGTNGLHITQNGGTQAFATIADEATYNMKTGMFALGRYPKGDVNDEAVAGTGFGGDFYEIIIIKEALTNTQVGNILGPLLNKYT